MVRDGIPGRDGRGELGRLYCFSFFFIFIFSVLGGSGVCPRRPSLVGLGQPPCSCRPHAGTGMLQRLGKLGAGVLPTPRRGTDAKSLPLPTNCYTVPSPRTVGTHVVWGWEKLGRKWSRTCVQNMVTLGLVTGRETGRWRFLGGRGIATVAVGFALYFGVLIFKELPV